MQVPAAVLAPGQNMDNVLASLMLGALQYEGYSAPMKDIRAVVDQTYGYWRDHGEASSSAAGMQIRRDLCVAFSDPTRVKPSGLHGAKNVTLEWSIFRRILEGTLQVIEEAVPAEARAASGRGRSAARWAGNLLDAAQRHVQELKLVRAGVVGVHVLATRERQF